MFDVIGRDKSAMGGDMKRKRDLERTYSRAQFVAKLRRLADSLEARRPFTIQVASERLHIGVDAVFNIEHVRSGNAEELEFQLRWHSGKTTQ